MRILPPVMSIIAIFCLLASVFQIRFSVLMSIELSSNSLPTALPQFITTEYNHENENEISPLLATKSTFPAHTRFTRNVNGIINTIETSTLTRLEGQKKPVTYWPELFCFDGIRIIVDEPFTPPSRIECKRNNYVCSFIKNIFASNTTILPYNTSIGVSNDDASWNGGGFYGWAVNSWGNCVASSSPLGAFAMTNFQDIEYHTNHRTTQEGYIFNHTVVPWEKRSPIPVFRGNPRIIRKESRWKKNGCPKNVTGMGIRMEAADFSFHNPHLLNALVFEGSPHTCRSYCCEQTYGMDHIFKTGIYKNRTAPSQKILIPSDQYYTEYQTAVVLGGNGAAFRTGRHLAGGQAVVLQDYYAKEWLVKFMRPYEHYISLNRDLSNLQQVMEWVRDNPDQVKQIAENGNRFYKDYLAFEPTEEHWYELLWRLSLSTHSNGSDRLKYGIGRAIWPSPIRPFAFERETTNGDWMESTMEFTMDLFREDAAIRKLSPDLLYLPNQWQGGVSMKEGIYKLKKSAAGWTGV